eukprot:GHVH01005434.1.p1 GENE.GHVH01005434.1~~GHVH01005434.1.p1  ORF type:complete len:427 (-),score=91.01 GHVH01005434.1:62-1342(-)
MLDTDWHEYVAPEKALAADGGRAFVEGVWDLMHSGHLNVFRQACKLPGTTSVTVGINEDSSVAEAKGATPIFNSEERAKLVQSSRYVDRVLVNYPYYNDYGQFKATDTDFICHGNDSIITPDGEHMYKPWVLSGQFRELQRTAGISTSSLMYRLLQASSKFMQENRLTKDLLIAVKIDSDELFSPPCPDSYDKHGERYRKIIDLINSGMDEWGRVPGKPQQMICSSIRLGNFLKDNHRERPPGVHVVYVDGAFDVIHPGHIDMLNCARQHGDWVVAGLFDDVTISNLRGSEFPIMSMMERSTVLLALKQVDEVVFGAPWVIDKQYIDSNQIQTIIKREELCDKGHKAINWALRTRTWECEEGRASAYDDAIKNNIEIVEPVMSFSASDLYRRIHSRRDSYIAIIDDRISKELVINEELVSKRKTSK